MEFCLQWGYIGEETAKGPKYEFRIFFEKTFLYTSKSFDMAAIISHGMLVKEHASPWKASQ